MKNNKKCFLKTISSDSTAHGVYDIIIYNFVYHNFQFLFCFLDISLFFNS